MNIIVIGAGYVGLVTGACFSELGNHVTCIDVDVEKINQLKKGVMPLYEPGLEALITSNMEQGRLQFTTTFSKDAPHPQIIFIAVGTPSDADGAADIKYVLKAAENIGHFIEQPCVVVDKSTVPVGMADQVEKVISNALTERRINIQFDVVSNPEFLREGAAIEDFMRPDRVIIGLDSDRAKNVMLDLYMPLLRSPERLFFMSVKDAEMTKYAANAMLATRISFMNEMAVLCEQMGVDIESVRLGIGSDSRIGSAFLHAGCGYGGSCFPKDVRALIKMAEKHHIDPMVLHAVEKRNFRQKNLLPQKVVHLFGEDLSQIRLGVWGLSFKPGTDDMREASSTVLLEEVIQRGAQVMAYDPAAMPKAEQIFPAEWFKEKKLTLTAHQYEALEAVDALILVTEWKPFCYPDVTAMKNLMRQLNIIDGRNQYDPKHLRDAGFNYVGIGRGTQQPHISTIKVAVA